MESENTLLILRKIASDYSEFNITIENELSYILKEGIGGIWGFLSSADEGLEILGEITSSIFNSFMASRMRRQYQPREISIVFPSRIDAYEAYKLLDNEKLRTYLKQEHLLQFAVEVRSRTVFLKFQTSK